jgi:hypothetical protein
MIELYFFGLLIKRCRNSNFNEVEVKVEEKKVP